MKFGNPGDRLRKKKWNMDELPKFEKNFYVEHPEVQRMSQVNRYISLRNSQTLMNRETFLESDEAKHISMSVVSF